MRMYIAEFVIEYGTRENVSEFGVQVFDCDFKSLSELEKNSFQKILWNHCPEKDEIDVLKNRLHDFYEIFCTQTKNYECLEMTNTFRFKSKKRNRQFNLSILLRPFKENDYEDNAYFRRKWKQEIK